MSLKGVSGNDISLRTLTRLSEEIRKQEEGYKENSAQSKEDNGAWCINGVPIFKILIILSVIGAIGVILCSITLTTTFWTIAALVYLPLSLFVYCYCNAKDKANLKLTIKEQDYIISELSKMINDNARRQKEEDKRFIENFYKQ